MAKSPKKTSRIEAVENASKEHKEVCRFLTKATVRKRLPIAKTKDPPSEIVLLDRLLFVDGPITANDAILQRIGSESTLFDVTKRLNKLLENLSNEFEVLKKSGVIITVHRHSGMGGLRVGRYFACQNTQIGNYLNSDEIRQLLDKAWNKFREAKTHIKRPETVERILKKVLEEQAKSDLSKKLHKRKRDYQPLAMEVGLVKTSIGAIDTARLVSGEQQRLDDQNRSWESFDPVELLNPQSIYILSSDTGTGKTTFLNYLQLKILEEKKLIPIIVHASALENQEFKDLKSFIHHLATILKLDQPETDIRNFLKKHFKKIILFVDGLDQIKGAGTDYSNLLHNLLGVFKKNLVITSRPFAVISQEEKDNLKFLRLKPFGKVTQEKYFGEHYNRACEICNSCRELMAIPMLAYMVRCLIEEKRDKHVNNRADLYEEFVNYILMPTMGRGYEHDKIRSNLDIETGVRQSLSEISYEALVRKNPHTQKIPLSFCEKYTTKHNTTIENILKHGFVNLIVDKTEKVDCLYFSHQSFQEYLAAEWASQNEVHISNILEKMWNLKLEEVIKFLAGIAGEDFVKRIYSKECRDNCIHSRLLLAAKCCGELGSPAAIEKFILSKLEEMLIISPFITNSAYGISNLNITEAGDTLIKFVEGKHKDPEGSHRHVLQDSVIEAVSNFGKKLTKDQKARFIKSAVLATDMRLGRFENALNKLIEEGVLNSKDIDWGIEYYCINESPLSQYISRIPFPSKSISPFHIDKAINFAQSPNPRQRASALLLLSFFLRGSRAESDYIQSLFHLLKPATADDKTQILDILSNLTNPCDLLPENVNEVINLFGDSDNVRNKVVETLMGWACSEYSREPFHFSAKHITKIRDFLKCSDFAIKKAAIRVLASILKSQFQQVITILLDIISESNEDIQLEVLTSVRPVIAQHKDLDNTYLFVKPYIEYILDLVKSPRDKLKDAAIDFLYTYRNQLFPQDSDEKTASVENIEVLYNLNLLWQSENKPLRKRIIQILKQESIKRSKPYINKLAQLIGADNPDAVEDCIEVLSLISGEISFKNDDIINECIRLFSPNSERISEDHITTIIDCLTSENFYIQITSFNLLEHKYHEKLNSAHTAKLLNILKDQHIATRFLAIIVLLNKLPMLSLKDILKILEVLCEQEKFVDRVRDVLEEKLPEILFFGFELVLMMKEIRILGPGLAFFEKILDGFSTIEIKDTARFFDVIGCMYVDADEKIKSLIEYALAKSGEKNIDEIINIYLTNPASAILTSTIQKIPEDFLSCYKDRFFDLIEHPDRRALSNGLDIFTKLSARPNTVQVNKLSRLLKDPDPEVRHSVYGLLNSVYRSGFYVPPNDYS
jgi:hypothetical protein